MEASRRVYFRDGVSGTTKRRGSEYGQQKAGRTELHKERRSGENEGAEVAPSGAPFLKRTPRKSGNFTDSPFHSFGKGLAGHIRRCMESK